MTEIWMRTFWLWNEQCKIELDRFSEQVRNFRTQKTIALHSFCIHVTKASWCIRLPCFDTVFFFGKGRSWARDKHSCVEIIFNKSFRYILNGLFSVDVGRCSALSLLISAQLLLTHTMVNYIRRISWIERGCNNESYSRIPDRNLFPEKYIFVPSILKEFRAIQLAFDCYGSEF